MLTISAATPISTPPSWPPSWTIVCSHVARAVHRKRVRGDRWPPQILLLIVFNTHSFLVSLPGDAGQAVLFLSFFEKKEKILVEICIEDGKKFVE